MRVGERWVTVEDSLSQTPLPRRQLRALFLFMTSYHSLISAGAEPRHDVMSQPAFSNKRYSGLSAPPFGCAPRKRPGSQQKLQPVRIENLSVENLRFLRP